MMFLCFYFIQAHTHTHFELLGLTPLHSGRSFYGLLPDDTMSAFPLGVFPSDVHFPQLITNGSLSGVFGPSLLGHF